MRNLIHLLIFIVLTIITQIGGIIYIVSVFCIKKKPRYKLKRTILFLLLYLISSILIVPNIAPFFGRIKIDDNHIIESHNIITKLCNRNYVKPELYDVLTDVSLKINKDFPDIKLIYLDANFPFFDGFPLLPHLSHNDGRKIDVSFIYKDKNMKLTNEKPSK
ncbi:hypothetical protein [uncultured Polaribacter sp.]|uniref:hypothetical protein n=1 Tax=uncultured Polaribacter sp. TaxID=174711 RepID=UPI002614E756|nr:hypothetical protein [uncultured Polaribacter sp.]